MSEIRGSIIVFFGKNILRPRSRMTY